MRYILAVLIVVMSCAKSIYQVLNCTIRLATGSCPRNVVMSGKHYRAAFGVSMRFCIGILLFFVSLPVHGSSAVADSAEQTDSLQNCDSICVFTENLLFPQSSAVILRDFAENGAAIDSIRRFFTVTDSLNLIDIEVIGSYSPEGKAAFNEKLAEARARALGNLVREIASSVNPEVSTSHIAAGQTHDYRKLRSAKLQIAYRNTTVVSGTVFPDTAALQEKTVPEEPCDSAAAETHCTDTVRTITPPVT